MISAKSNAPPEVLARADQFYADRGKVVNVSASVELLRQPVACFETSWRIARACFFLGQEADQPKTAVDFHRAGATAADLAARATPDNVEGHFWLGVNLALMAQLESPLKAVVDARRAKRALQRAIRLDASYHAAGPLRVLARLQHKLPRLLGGGLADSQANFERALSLAPANTVTRIYFAELLLEIGAVERARAQLQMVLSAPPDAAWSFEIERDQRLAQKLLTTFV